MKSKIFFLLALIIFLVGCATGQVVKEPIRETTCPEKECPNLDCSTCPSKIEEKIIEKKVEVTKYVCADGKEVKDKTLCINYIDKSWNLDENKELLVQRLNRITGTLGFTNAVEVSKLVTDADNIEIGYTQTDGNFQVQNVGQTMFDVLQETIKFLKENKKLEYNIKITALTANGGFVFSKLTTKSDVLKILNYEIGTDEWIDTIKKVK